MLAVKNLFKSYGPVEVLSDISFTLPPSERAGLIGPNGSGKSTLLKILSGAESPDSGEIVLAPSITSCYLPQTISDMANQTIDAVLMKAAGDLREIETRMHRLEDAISRADENQLHDLTAEYEQVSGRFEELEGYDAEHRIESTLDGLGIGYLSRSRTIDTLSGGQRTRISLAGVLLHSPDLLLLDEPTNNLDLQSLGWLEAYLLRHKGAMLVASHDRQFLNNVATIIFDINEHSHRLEQYPGNYDDYKSAKVAEMAKWEEDYRRQQQEVHELTKAIRAAGQSRPRRSKAPTDGDKFVPYFKGQRVQQSMSRTVRNAEERLKRIEQDPISQPPKPLRFKPNVRLQSIKSAEVIRAAGISKSFGSRRVLDNVDLNVSYDSRVVITGPNGSGKSTLLRILVGSETSDAGQVAHAPAARIGFLPQEPELGDRSETVLEYYRRGQAGYEEDFVFDLVTCGFFRYEELGKPVGQLSLGQVRKLQIARMIAEEPNVLILDEPTNHVSLDVLESLEVALAEFQGPILSVSHDRRFIQSLGREVWEMRDGGIAR